MRFLPSTFHLPLGYQVAALRAASGNLPNDYLVVLVGDMVTEVCVCVCVSALKFLQGGLGFPQGWGVDRDAASCILVAGGHMGFRIPPFQPGG